MFRSIDSVLIAGYGTMGRGVAKTFAAVGIRTTIWSRRAADLTDLPKGVTASASLPADPPDLIIEFLPEDLALKLEAFAAIEKAYGDAGFLLATGTSGIDMADLARPLKRLERLLALHYFMPADVSPVVEVGAGPATPPEALEAAAEVMRRTGKEPVVVVEPIIGFLVNRLQHAMLHEAYYLIETGVASAADVDHSVRRLLGPRMCISGLVQQKDLSGLVVNAASQRSIVPALFHNRTPNPMLQAMPARGETGLDAGRGFYDWTDCNPKAVREQAARRLKRLIEFLDTGLGEDEPGTTPKSRALGVRA